MARNIENIVKTAKCFNLLSGCNNTKKNLGKADQFLLFRLGQMQTCQLLLFC